MAGSHNITGDQSIYFTDNLSFDGTQRGGALSADGELWIGATAANRANNGGHVRKGTLTAGTGITITNGPGSITISTTGGAAVTTVTGTPNRITSTGGATPQIDIAATYVGQASITTLGTVTTGTWNGTVVGATFGGTGQSTYTTGDILYASAANTLSKLAIGTTGQVLTVTGGIPQWATPATSFKVQEWKASDFDALEANFAPINTDAGANAIESIRSFDDTTEEYVNFSFVAPSTITTGTVTFRAYGYAATAAAARFVQLRFGHTALSASDSWDQAYTNVDSGDSAVDTTQDDITVVQWTETVANLGWTAEDLVVARLSRIAPAGANLVGDFQLISFAMEVPVSGGVGAGGGGGINSVSGTANRITSTGGTDPVIDIDAAYVGQASITTLGTVTTGAWNGTVVSEAYGGTNQSTYSTGDIIYASAPNTLSKRTVGTAGQVLTVSGGLPTWATSSSLTWAEETGATRALTINQGVVGNRGTAQTFTLPATAAQFSQIKIVQVGAGAITIDWTTNQYIQFGNQLATTTTGTLVSTAVGSSIELICTTTDNVWFVLSSTGNWTIT